MKSDRINSGMETTPESVLETFERNRQSVRDLLQFDAIVLGIVIDNLKSFNESWKNHLRKMDASGPADKVNPKWTMDNLIKLVANIRDNNSLSPKYSAMHNQCLVLLVSFFSSSARALFRAFVAQELQAVTTPILNERLEFRVADLIYSSDLLPELVADALEEKKKVSFQDMKSISRAFQAVLGIEPERDADVNNIIVALACRHAVVHADSRVDMRLLRQVKGAEPRQLKPSLGVATEISFSENEIEVAGKSMYNYLAKVIQVADDRL
jgi:hypothetical protein